MEGSFKYVKKVRFDLCTASEVAVWTRQPWGRCLAMAMREVFVLITVELFRLGQAARAPLMCWARFRLRALNLANRNQTYDGSVAGLDASEQYPGKLVRKAQHSEQADEPSNNAEPGYDSICDR